MYDEVCVLLACIMWGVFRAGWLVVYVCCLSKNVKLCERAKCIDYRPYIYDAVCVCVCIGFFCVFVTCYEVETEEANWGGCGVR